MSLPLLYISKLNLLCGTAAKRIGQYGYTESDCPVDLMPVHDRSLFKNGRPIQGATFAPRWLSMGQGGDHIDFDADGQEVFYGGFDAPTRWDWCQTYAQGDWYVQAIDPYAVTSNERELYVLFDRPEDEAAFLVAFPDAGV